MGPLWSFFGLVWVYFILFLVSLIKDLRSDSNGSLRTSLSEFERKISKQAKCEPQQLPRGARQKRERGTAMPSELSMKGSRMADEPLRKGEARRAGGSMLRKERKKRRES